MRARELDVLKKEELEFVKFMSSTQNRVGGGYKESIRILCD